ncbi:MAG: hypothetical protein RSD70_07835, partial [Acidaminococcaceae bacterium]
AADIGSLSEQEVLDRISRLKEVNIIRRMSGFFNSAKLGYVANLCAVQVAPADIPAVVAVINAFPGITHNYERDYTYNLWFTLLAISPQATEAVLSTIAATPGVQGLLRFPGKKMFKLNVTFPL